MAYTRYHESGHYIFGGVDYVDFNGRAIADDEIDVFIYKLYGYMKDGDEEFWERFHHGSRAIDNFQKGIHIRNLTKRSVKLEAEAAVIAVLADEIWREHYTPIIGEAQVDYMLKKFQSAEQICEDIKQNAYIYFIAEHIKSGEIIGYCAAQPKEDYLLLSKLYIRRDYRGRGFARSFLDEVTALCRWEYGFDKIRLTVNKNNSGAIAAYQKMGFETIDSIKADIGGGFFMDDFVMELTINCNIENIKLNN
jgi:RimJ/RimL family protein N-acetyltransferase